MNSDGLSGGKSSNVHELNNGGLTSLQGGGGQVSGDGSSGVGDYETESSSAVLVEVGIRSGDSEVNCSRVGESVLGDDGEDSVGGSSVEGSTGGGDGDEGAAA